MHEQKLALPTVEGALYMICEAGLRQTLHKTAQAPSTPSKSQWRATRSSCVRLTVCRCVVVAARGRRSSGTPEVRTVTNDDDLRGAHAWRPRAASSGSQRHRCCRKSSDYANPQESFYFDEREARHGGIEIVSESRSATYVALLYVTSPCCTHPSETCASRGQG